MTMASITSTALRTLTILISDWNYEPIDDSGAMRLGVLRRRTMACSLTNGTREMRIMKTNGENACKENGIVFDPFPIIPEFFVVGHMAHGSRRLTILV
jgi:hypothetical protein